MDANGNDKTMRETHHLSMAHPIIGFTLDYETGGGYSKLPWYAIRENYMSAVAAFGAVPVALPHEPELAAQYLELIDGLVITGGAFDVPPEMYGDKSVHKTVTTKEGRTQFEQAITRGALAKQKPILGICGGEQLLNVILGGTLIQHIPDSIKNALEHEQKNPRTEPGHTVRIVDGTLLHKIVGQAEIPVNSAHHQAVATVGKGVVVNATAPDGVIEGIEYPAHKFCLGVEWHPEYHISPADTKIFEAFVGASKSS
jgi:putative glutamine amidotransferase